MDDILIASSNLAEIEKIKKEFTTRYKMKDLGDLEFYLGMRVTSAMALAKNPTHHKRSKHIDIKYHWLREHTYKNGTVELEHCKTEDMHADVMTKALASEDHIKTCHPYQWKWGCLRMRFLVF